MPDADVSQVVHALRLALDVNAELRLQSLTHLQLAATSPNFYPSLVRIFSATDLDLGPDGRQIRQQAVVQFKNGVEKYWRRGAPNAIPLEEKLAIRPQLLAMVNEPDRVLAKTVALCIAKIARLDYGIDWDDLPESLVESLRTGLNPPAPSNGLVVLHRTLLFLQATIKSLSSNRIMKGRLLMKKVGNILFPTLRDIYQHVLQIAVNKLDTEGVSSIGEVDELEIALLSFKCLAKLTVYGCGDASEDPTAKDFFSGTPTTLASLIALRLRFIPPAPAPPPHATPRLLLLTKLVIAHIKLYRALIGHDAAVFARMGVASEIIETVWRSISDASQSPSTSISDELTAPYPERFVVLSLLLLKSTMGDWAAQSPVSVPPEFVRQFVEILVTKLLPLRAIDLEKWAEDPEEWMNEEEADRSIDFDAWLVETLAPEAVGTDSNYRIIRRRIAWLVGKWVEEDLKPETLRKIYSLLVHLLGRNASTDTAIRLTAARSLAKCGDTWDFDSAVFIPFLPAAIEEIVSLLGEVTLPDSQMRLNQTLGVVIDRVQAAITPYAQRLAEILATLWAVATENHFQTSVLVTLTKLAEALGEQSRGLHAQACPIILLSVDPSLPAHVYLQEDGLELWQVLLRRSDSLSQEMLSLLPLLLSLLSSGTDVLPRVLRILESYLLLDASRVLQLCSNDLFVSFENLLGDLNIEPLKAVLRAMEAVFSTAPTVAWAQALDGSNAMLKILKSATGTESAQIVTKYLCTTSRIVLADPVSLRDPVHSIKMIPFLREKIGQVQALHGGPDAFQAAHLSRVDPAVLEELYKRLQGQIQG
ncbi:hypothetical protein RQP46_005009 [Phenoliferia psychrophenolica]